LDEAFKYFKAAKEESGVKSLIKLFEMFKIIRLGHSINNVIIFND